MPPWIADWISTGGGVGIVAAFLYAILRGHLVPRRVVDDMRTDKDKQITELGKVLDVWRNAAQAKDEAIKEFIPMLNEIIENERLIFKLFGAICEVIDTEKPDKVDP